MPSAWCTIVDVRNILSGFGRVDIPDATISPAISRAKGWMRAKIQASHTTAIDALAESAFDETHPIRTAVGLRAAAMSWLAQLGADNMDKMPESLARLFDEAEALRDDIAENPFGSGAAVESSGEAHSNTMTYGRPLDVDDDIKWAHDSDKITDIADERA